MSVGTIFRFLSERDRESSRVQKQRPATITTGEQINMAPGRVIKTVSSHIYIYIGQFETTSSFQLEELYRLLLS